MKKIFLILKEFCSWVFFMFALTSFMPTFSDTITKSSPLSAVTVARTALPIKTPTENYVQNEMIVMFEPKSSEIEREKILSVYGTSRPFKRNPNIFVVTIKKKISVNDAIKSIKTFSQVVWAQPNYVKKIPQVIRKNPFSGSSSESITVKNEK